MWAPFGDSISARIKHKKCYTFLKLKAQMKGTVHLRRAYNTTLEVIEPSRETTDSRAEWIKERSVKLCKALHNLTVSSFTHPPRCPG